MNTNLSVLFLDDEPGVLEGIQRMLRHNRKSWEMEFHSSVPIALERIQAKSFDVVVSDMRMPAMDGATFLKQVQRLSPETRRIILSGQSDEESLVRSAVICHQYLSKPCSSENLREAILRGDSLRDHNDTIALRRKLVGCTCVASPFETVDKIKKLLKSTLPSLDDLEQVILDDIGLFAKVLQIFGASLFAMPIQPKDMRQILANIGLEKLQRIFAHEGVVSEIENSRDDSELLRKLNADSKRVAIRARSIMAELEPKNTYMQFLAYASGMLHTISQCARPDQAIPPSELTGSQSSDEQSSPFSGRAIVAQTSSFLLDIWGLPTPIVQAVADTERPLDLLDPMESLSVSLGISLLLEDASPESNCRSLIMDDELNDGKYCLTLQECLRQLGQQSELPTGESK